MEMSKSLIRLVLAIGVLYLVLMLFAPSWPPFSGGIRGKHLKEHKDFAAMFKAGNTSAPLLAMDWFSDHGVYFCRVTQTGMCFSARDVGHAIQGGNRISLDISTNGANGIGIRDLLIKLPPSSKKSLPVERQILIGGILSNQWFDRVYDRADVPQQVEKIYETTGAYLDWCVPLVQGRHIPLTRTSICSFAVASAAPIAVFVGANGAQVWNLKTGSFRDIASVTNMPTTQGLGDTVAISPDGNILVLLDIYGVYGVDLQAQRLLWKTLPLDHDDVYGARLAMDGGGRYLFTAGQHIVERRDLFSGKSLAKLTNSATGLSTLLSSQDGRILLAGFGGNSFLIWESGNDKPVYEFVEPEAANVGLSPDGQTIIMSEFGDNTFSLLEWRTGKRKVVPLRGASGASSAYSMYWSPDGKRLAAYIDSYPASILVYDTATWKPLAQWCCDEIGGSSKFAFATDGLFLQKRGNDINALDVSELKGAGD
jgi:hypothetical protein